MTSPTTAAPVFSSHRRLVGLAATALVHLALLLGWQLARQAPPVQAEGASTIVQWVALPAPAPATAPQAQSRPPQRDRPVRAAPLAAIPAPALTPQAAPLPSPATTTEAAPAPSAPSAAEILAQARSSAGEIDRALRKDSKPTIVLPPDSPQIRMRERMQLARELAPSRLWEAPKVAELVNNTGDGARRTRVITGNGTYCVTERPPTTGIDMIEKHGKQTFTNCPEHEEPAKAQAWRTARD